MRALPALILLFPLHAGAQYLTGRDLLDLCARHDQEVGAGDGADVVRHLTQTATCRGYLMGVADRVEAEPAAGVCVPGETTLAELLAALRGYAERQPDILSRPASDAVAASLRRAFPCPEAQRGPPPPGPRAGRGPAAR